MHDLFLTLLTIPNVIIHSLQKQKLRHEKFSSLSYAANKSRNIDVLIREPASPPPLCMEEGKEGLRWVKGTWQWQRGLIS